MEEKEKVRKEKKIEKGKGMEETRREYFKKCKKWTNKEEAIGELWKEIKERIEKVIRLRRENINRKQEQKYDMTRNGKLKREN